MFLEIITPDKKLFSGEVTSVTVPGKKGRFQILNRHAPIISTLQKGDIKVKSNKEVLNFSVNSGVVEVLNNKIIILAS
ncbi:MAG TPA: ATP synthase F1 subunit epsilon [Bacteroidia bacterium]|nr:ATP synthase F1 subunit epsilon [Bacteroidia bacterium]HNT80411.1 ATP synthase F1 subunit epsilon [Bacteroidia bacterium]